jgi:hypothetical protein
VADLTNIFLSAEAVKRASQKEKLKGKLSVCICFDRSKPTVKIYDNASHIELTLQEIDALRDWLTTP